MNIEIEKTMSLGEDERKAKALESMMEAVREAVEQIALARRTGEITFGISTEEFDKMLNERCEEAQARFGTMTEREIAQYMLHKLLSDLVG